MRSTAFSLLLTALAVGLIACGDAEKMPLKNATKPLQPAANLSSENPKGNTPDIRQVIIAFGDSLTAGYGVEESQNYPSKLQARLDAMGYTYRVVNAGVSGDTTAQGLNRLQWVLDLSPKIVIVELGPNDGLRGLPLDSTRQNLEEIVRRCQERGAKVILAGMTLPGNYTRNYIRTFERMYKELSRAYKTPLIPFFLEGVAMRPELNLGDGIHPNAAGYDIVTSNVWRSLQPLLRR